MFWIKDIKAIFINYYFFLAYLNEKQNVRCLLFQLEKIRLKKLLRKGKINSWQLGGVSRGTKLQIKIYAKKFGYCLITKVK